MHYLLLHSDPGRNCASATVLAAALAHQVTQVEDLRLIAALVADPMLEPPRWQGWRTRVTIVP